MRWLTLTGGFSDNAIGNNSAGTFTRSNARTSQFSATMTPRHNLRILYKVHLSDTGNFSALPGYQRLTNTPTTTGSATDEYRHGRQYHRRQMRALGPDNGAAISRYLLQRNQCHHKPEQYQPQCQLKSDGPVRRRAETTAWGSIQGNYSNNLGSAYNTYGASSYGGALYQPHRFGISATRQSASRPSTGQFIQYRRYQFNSNRNTIGFNLGWQLFDRMQVNATYSTQQLHYNGAAGGTSSNTMLLSMQAASLSRYGDRVQL